MPFGLDFACVVWFILAALAGMWATRSFHLGGV